MSQRGENLRNTSERSKIGNTEAIVLTVLVTNVGLKNFIFSMIDFKTKYLSAHWKSYFIPILTFVRIISDIRLDCGCSWGIEGCTKTLLGIDKYCVILWYFGSFRIRFCRREFHYTISYNVYNLSLLLLFPQLHRYLRIISTITMKVPYT